MLTFPNSNFKNFRRYCKPSEIFEISIWKYQHLQIPKSDFDRREICAAKKISGNVENVTMKKVFGPRNAPLKNLGGSF